jgi:YbbR domain-containing protein
MDTIASVVAKVEESATLEKTKRFSADLLALDAQGAQVDLADCTFVTPADGKVNLTVPVWVQRKVPYHIS